MRDLSALTSGHFMRRIYRLLIVGLRCLLFFVTTVLFIAAYKLLYVHINSKNGLDGLLEPYVRPLGWIAAAAAFFLIFIQVSRLPWLKTIHHRMGASLLIIMVGIFCGSIVFPQHYGACDEFTKELGGGVRTFKGESVKIELCSTRNHINYNLMDAGRVRLRILFMNDRLWAERTFMPVLTSQGPLTIKYGEDYLTYYDEASDESEVRMKMPPSYWEWLKAKFPKLLP